MYRNPAHNPDERGLAADHTVTRASGGRRADRLLHSTCNEQRGDGTRDYQRPAILSTRGGHAGNIIRWTTGGGVAS